MGRKSLKQQADELATRIKISVSKRQKLYDNYNLESFGFPSDLLETEGSGIKALRNKIKLMNNYLDNKKLYSVTNIQSKEHAPVYVPEAELREYAKLSSEYIRQKLNISEAQKSVIKTYKGIDKKGNIIEKPYDTTLNINAESGITVYKLPNGRVLLDQSILRNKLFKKLPRELKSEQSLSSKFTFDESLGNLRSRAYDYTYKHAKEYMSNYLVALYEHVSPDLAIVLSDIIKRDKITPMEFLYLYYSDEAFDIGFIYSSEQVKNMEDLISSSILNLRMNEKDKYTEFVKIAFEGEKIHDKYVKPSFLTEFTKDDLSI